jgi:hypothetical protein
MDQVLYSTQDLLRFKRFNVLKTLGEIGWGRAHDIALWSPLSHTEAEEITRRVLKDLSEEGLVTSIKLPNRCGTAYILTISGIRHCDELDIRVSWKGHKPPSIGNRFHEHLMSIQILATLGSKSTPCFFARDIAWAKNSGDGFKKLLGKIPYSIPPKAVDALSVIKYFDDWQRPIYQYYHTEIEWSHKKGEEMWGQVKSIEVILERDPRNFVILAYPQDPKWRSDFLRKAGKTEAIVDHKKNLVYYMGQSKIILDNADRVYFAALKIDGNFKTYTDNDIGTDEFSLGLMRKLSHEINTEEWEESETYCEIDSKPGKIVITHKLSGAVITTVRELGYSDLAPGWYRDYSYPIIDSESQENSEKFSPTDFEPFDHPSPEDKWPEALAKSIEWVLDSMFFDPESIYHERLHTRVEKKFRETYKEKKNEKPSIYMRESDCFDESVEPEDLPWWY